MVTSVRLDQKTEKKLARLARETGRTRSELIREAIGRLVAQVEEGEGRATAYDRLAAVIGTVNLGPGSRAARSEEILRGLFAARRRR